MAELTQEVIDVVESTKWPDCVRQDFYVHWLEKTEPFVFVNEWHTRKFVNQFMSWIKTNNARKEGNRTQLRADNHDDIIRNLGLNGTGDDPYEEVEADELILKHLESLSAVLLTTLIQYYVEGRSPEDIAKMGNENVEAVRKRITRARNLLKGEK